MSETFGALALRYRRRADLSCNELAQRVGVDASYISRWEREQREPPRRAVVDQLALALDLTPFECAELCVSAGYAPDAVLLLGRWDDALDGVLRVLSDSRLTPEQQARFCDVLRLLVEQWSAPVVEPRIRAIEVA